MIRISTTDQNLGKRPANIKGRHAFGDDLSCSPLCVAQLRRACRLATFSLAIQLILSLFQASPLHAQVQNQPGTQPSDSVNTAAAINVAPNKKKAKKPRKKLLPGSFVIAPLPLVSPA